MTIDTDIRCKKCRSRYTESVYHTQRFSAEGNCKVPTRHMHNTCKSCGHETFVGMLYKPDLDVPGGVQETLPIGGGK